ncbi:FAD linked oxidase domain protein [Beijerinckiaceae bacterium RH AL1]|nr:FAD linked oxidase domain protein [Beijerinckiaceae bacterium RH CH11]VVB49816.1 FAD linked oxidase domain protein [Beijerinckiaceae bacterium RH AL8]VVC57052.1 FAD linked oxidase domain protein [Beijerinckiaceae bacterium RH AL1]
MDIIKPRDEDEVLAAVQSALLSETPLEVVGHGSKRGLGHAVAAAAQLDLSGLSGVDLYEPTELVLRAKPATPLDEIEALLDAHSQELAFEPMNPGTLWRGNRTGTLGGAVAVNAGGPRRIKAGAARDHVLGFRAVSGRGDIFKSGGQVMKNVTGYDLSKLMAGSHGTLAVMTEVTVKVLPKAETERTFLMYGLDEAAACAALREASGLSYETSSFACLPDGGWADLPPGCCLALRLEGPAVSVDTRFEDLVAHFGPRGNVDDLGEAASRRLWAGLRDAAPVADVAGPVWRVSTAPSAGAAFVADVRAAGVPVTRWYYDWAGGLVWLALEGSEPHAAKVRETLARHGGHATLVRADDAVRATTPVFHPQPAPLAALSKRIKASFDPAGILNPGRVG